MFLFHLCCFNGQFIKGMLNVVFSFMLTFWFWQLEVKGRLGLIILLHKVTHLFWQRYFHLILFTSTKANTLGSISQKYNIVLHSLILQHTFIRNQLWQLQATINLLVIFYFKQCVFVFSGRFTVLTKIEIMANFTFVTDAYNLLSARGA